MTRSMITAFALCLQIIALSAARADDTAAGFEFQRKPFFSSDIPYEPMRPRSVILPPLASLLVPGFDQWWENQRAQALALTGFAGAGLGLSASVLPRLEEKKDVDRGLDSRDNDARAFLLGSQMYGAAGSMSAYLSFRSAVRTQQPLGAFGFLEYEESVDDLLSAPLDFSMLKRPTTYVPLAIITGLMIGHVTSNGDPFHANSFNASDAGFASSFSYLAGTNEEALFRGWMMPVYRDSWGSDFWSNTAQATVFSLAHVSPDNPVPWPQFALGWYLGYVAQRNHWTLRESVFIHAWWDALAFVGGYLHDSKNGSATALYLPAIFLTF